MPVEWIAGLVADPEEDGGYESDPDKEPGKDHIGGKGGSQGDRKGGEFGRKEVDRTGQNEGIAEHHQPPLEGSGHPAEAVLFGRKPVHFWSIFHRWALYTRLCIKASMYAIF